jgi:hypothetical protein
MSDVPPGLTGVWRRELITTASGHRDAATHVFWLQTRSWYGDIRIPPTRPARPSVETFDAYSSQELEALAGMQGFAGQLTADERVCVWRRDLDFQPPSASPDEGTYALDGDVMIERGIHADYEEVWRLEPASRGALIAFALKSGAGGPRGLLLVAGDHFLSITDRPDPLPPGETLKDIVEAALAEGGPAAAAKVLTMPIVYGRIAGGSIPWQVVHATWPWLEGQGLWAGTTVEFAPRTQTLHQMGAGLALSWAVLDSSEPIEAVAGHLHLPLGQSQV